MTDTATIMQIRDSFDWIENELDTIMTDIENLAKEYRLQPSKNYILYYCYFYFTLYLYI